MFSVRVKREALDHLTAIWLASDDETRLTVATAFLRMKERLKIDPENEGESRDNDRRVCFEAPLPATFKVNLVASEVSILRVWEW